MWATQYNKPHSQISAVTMRLESTWLYFGKQIMNIHTFNMYVSNAYSVEGIVLSAEEKQ